MIHIVCSKCGFKIGINDFLKDGHYLRYTRCPNCGYGFYSGKPEPEVVPKIIHSVDMPPVPLWLSKLRENQKLTYMKSRNKKKMKEVLSDEREYEGS
jgi:hypothetical protein